MFLEKIRYVQSNFVDSFSLPNTHPFVCLIFTQIFQYLELQDLLNCAEVCCSWKSIIQSNTLWSQVSTKKLLLVFIGNTRVCFFGITETRVSQFLPFLDQLLCGERLDNGQYNEGNSEEKPHSCHPSQPSRLHISRLEQPKMHQ